MPVQCTPLVLPADVAGAINADTSNATVSARLLDLCVKASAWWQRQCRRRFDEYVATHRYTALPLHRGGHVMGRDLWLDGDLRSVTALTNGDGATVGAESYTLIGESTDGLDGVTAYQFVHLNDNAGIHWSYATDPLDAISLTGRWGYGGQWVAVGTTLSAAITDAAATTFSVTSGTNVQAGMVLKLGTDSEYLYVESVATNTVTATRGYNGSTATTHLIGLALYRWQALDLTRENVARLVAWKMEQNKAPLFGQAVIGDIVYPVTTDGVPKDVVYALQTTGLKRTRLPVGV